MTDRKSRARVDLPYTNLILTGFLGVGKTTIGRHLAETLGADFFDIDEEIELRELMSIAKLRELYGDQRLRALEHDLSRHAALMRRSVIVVPGAALLDSRNYRLLEDTGLIVVLTCVPMFAAMRSREGSGPTRLTMSPRCIPTPGAIGMS